MKVFCGGMEFDAGIFGGNDERASGYVIRLFSGKEEQHFKLLSNVVIVQSCAGFLYLRFIGGDAVLSGFELRQ